MLTNLFEAENHLFAALNDGVIVDGMVFKDEETSKLKLDVFKGLPVNQRAAALIQYEGLSIADSTGNSRNQLIEVKYRVIVVAPVTEKTLAGSKMIEVLQTLSGWRMDASYSPLTMIDDIREFNAAQYGDGMIAIPVLLSFKTPLR